MMMMMMMMMMMVMMMMMTVVFPSLPLTEKSVWIAESCKNCTISFSLSVFVPEVTFTKLELTYKVRY